MTRESIMEEIKTQLNKEEIKESDKFKEDYSLDSIDLVEMLMDIEEKYNIEIPDEKAAQIKTVGDFTNIILEEVK